MAQTLYRKYRPQQFSDLVNQNHIRAVLEHELASGDIAHAYLFTGPRGVGKTTVARLFAKSANCLSRKDHEPCNKCDLCVAMNENRLLDVIEIDAASHTQVDHVREHIIPNARTSPSQGKYKVFIIDEVHMLSTSAFNALLKILEEPPATVIFILATTEVHRVPETIISRCQRFDFKKVTPRDLIARLDTLAQREKRSVDDDVLAAIARLSDGSVRDAESLLGQVLGLGEKKISWDVASLVLPRSDLKEVLTFVEHLYARRLIDGLTLVNRLVEEGVDMGFFARDLLEFLRWSLLRQAGSGAERFSSIDPESVPPALNDLISQSSPKQTLQYIEHFSIAQRDLRDAPLPQFPFELALLTLFAEETDAAEAGNTVVPLVSPAVPTEEPKKNPATAKPAASKQGTQGILTREEVQKHWSTFVKETKQANPSLAIIMQTGVLVDVEHGTILIGCPYQFHLERLNDPKVRTQLEERLGALLDQQVHVRAILHAAPVAAVKTPEKKPAPSKEDPQSGDLWEQVLSTFGGEVVD
jgi:DNA polymerase-3 subunit gamma/tau